MSQPGSTVAAVVPLVVALETQKITVEGDNTAVVSTDPSANAGALVLRGEDLEALSDDPRSACLGLTGSGWSCGRAQRRPDLHRWIFRCAAASKGVNSRSPYQPEPVFS